MWASMVGNRKNRGTEIPSSWQQIVRGNHQQVGKGGKGNGTRSCVKPPVRDVSKKIWKTLQKEGGEEQGGEIVDGGAKLGCLGTQKCKAGGIPSEGAILRIQ